MSGRKWIYLQNLLPHNSHGFFDHEAAHVIIAALQKSGGFSSKSRNFCHPRKIKENSPARQGYSATGVCLCPAVPSRNKSRLFLCPVPSEFRLQSETKLWNVNFSRTYEKGNKKYHLYCQNRSQARQYLSERFRWRLEGNKGAKWFGWSGIGNNKKKIFNSRGISTAKERRNLKTKGKNNAFRIVLIKHWFSNTRERNDYSAAEIQKCTRAMQWFGKAFRDYHHSIVREFETHVWCDGGQAQRMPPQTVDTAAASSDRPRSGTIACGRHDKCDRNADAVWQGERQSCTYARRSGRPVLCGRWDRGWAARGWRRRRSGRSSGSGTSVAAKVDGRNKAPPKKERAARGGGRDFKKIMV